MAKEKATAVNATEIPAPPEKIEEHIPTAQEVIPSNVLRIRLARLVQKQYELGQEEKTARDARKPVTDEIKKILGENQIGKVQCNDYRVNYFSSTYTKISAEKLLMAGVSPRIIEQCTVKSESRTLKITMGDKEEE